MWKEPGLEFGLLNSRIQLNYYLTQACVTQVKFLQRVNVFLKVVVRLHYEPSIVVGDVRFRKEA